MHPIQYMYKRCRTAKQYTGEICKYYPMKPYPYHWILSIDNNGNPEYFRKVRYQNKRGSAYLVKFEIPIQ